MRTASFVVIAALGACSWLWSATNAQALSLDLVASGFTQSLYVTAPVNDSRLFVVEKTGAIKVVVNGVVQSTPYLDLSGSVGTAGERGLLGMAFDPNYSSNGRFYVNYIDQATSNTVVARYTVSAGNANVANTTSQTIITIAQPPGRNNHKGGWLGFRPGDTSSLYIAVGDGGSGNDPDGNGQNLASNLGKILRLDVSGSGASYAIPAGNPFVGLAGNDEIWAYGVRNPFRNSFDRLTGDFYIGDVGQDTREEVDFEAAPGTGGRNYGWRAREGTGDNPAVGDAAPGNAVDPIFDYTHTGTETGTASITGGYVYRGSKIPGFQGTYLYGDFVNGTFGSFVVSGGAATQITDRTLELDPTGQKFPNSSLTSFGEDGFGELYAVSYSGSVYQLVPEPSCAALLGLAGILFATIRRRSA